MSSTAMKPRYFLVSAVYFDHGPNAVGGDGVRHIGEAAELTLRPP